MIQINIGEIKITYIKTPSKKIATCIPKSATNHGLFLCQNCRDEMYNEVPSNPKCPTSEND